MTLGLGTTHISEIKIDTRCHVDAGIFYAMVNNKAIIDITSHTIGLVLLKKQFSTGIDLKKNKGASTAWYFTQFSLEIEFQDNLYI